MSNDQFDLTQRVAVITGATSGMGAHVAERYAASGAKLALMSRNPKDLQAKVDELNARWGKGKTIAVPSVGTLADKADLQKLVDTAVDAFGKVTTMLCSPTIDPWIGRTIDMPDEAVEEQLLYVFTSRFWLSCMCIREMLKTGGGQLIYIGSGSPFEATAERSVNTCARAAELQMMKNFAAEYGPDNIRANIIAPASVASSGSVLTGTPQGEARIAKLPLRRYGRPQEIAAAAAFLASDASSFTTGAVVPVDGGRLLHAVYGLLAGPAMAKKQQAGAPQP